MALIEEKILLNGSKNMVLYRSGLGSKAGILSLYLGPESGEASLLAGASRTSRSTQTPVTIVRGDDYFLAAGIDKIDIVKIDIEGYEKHAIEGMETHLVKWRPIMMIEISESGREQFGGFAMFLKTFLKDYDFYFCQQDSNLTVRTTLRRADEKAYEYFVGNVFCIPEERKNLFVAMAANVKTDSHMGSASHERY